MAERDYNRLRETQLGEDLYSYLLSRNKLPEIKRTSFLGDGTTGTWTPSDNLIKLLFEAGGGTLTHEAAHAADTALDRQYYDRRTSFGVPDTPTYFTDAYDKLKGRGPIASNNYTYPRRDMAKRMAPEWYNKNQDYRATTNELAGWGAGRQAGVGEPSYSPPNHLDSTMATELSILMELAKRNDKPFPKQPSWFERFFK